MKSKVFILVALAFMAMSAYCEEVRIVSITAVTEEVDHAPKTTFVVVEYDMDIRNASLTPDAFEVKDRTITKVYANNERSKSATGTDGEFVIIELSPYDAPAPGSCQENGPDRQLDIAVEVRQVKSLTATDDSSIPATKDFMESNRQVDIETKK